MEDVARILLIEDDSSLRENTQEMLELAGHKVFSAEDGETGLQQALQNSIDLILCDIILPGINGYSVLDKISSNPRTRTIPFIFLTALSNIKDIRHGMNLGADDYLVKPFEEQDLLETINSRLAKFSVLKDREIDHARKAKISINTLEDFRNYFRAHGGEIELSKNELLFRENQPAGYVYLLTQGIIKTLSLDEYGKELITGIYHKDDFLGIYSFNRNITYPEQALVIEPAKLLRLPLRLVQDIFRDNPQFTMEWAESLSKDVIELKDHLLQTAYASVLKKTVNTILEFSEKLHFNKKELSKISRGDLASVAGISKESFIRCLSTLKQDKLIEINGKNIKVLDLKGLKKIK